VLQHLTTLLQGALTATGREHAVLSGNVVMLLVLVPCSALAAAGTTLAGFAAARAAAEIARVAALAVQGKAALAAGKAGLTDLPSILTLSGKN
jgi:hypothetical protein